MIVKGNSRMKQLRSITVFSSNAISLFTHSTLSNVSEKSAGGIQEQYFIETLEGSSSWTSRSRDGRNSDRNNVTPLRKTISAQSQKQSTADQSSQVQISLRSSQDPILPLRPKTPPKRWKLPFLKLFRRRKPDRPPQPRFTVDYNPGRWSSSCSHLSDFESVSTPSSASDQFQPFNSAHAHIQLNNGCARKALKLHHIGRNIDNTSFQITDESGRHITQPSSAPVVDFAQAPIQGSHRFFQQTTKSRFSSPNSSASKSGNARFNQAYVSGQPITQTSSAPVGDLAKAPLPPMPRAKSLPFFTDALPDALPDDLSDVYEEINENPYDVLVVWDGIPRYNMTRSERLHSNTDGVRRMVEPRTNISKLSLGETKYNSQVDSSEEDTDGYLLPGILERVRKPETNKLSLGEEEYFPLDFSSKEAAFVKTGDYSHLGKPGTYTLLLEGTKYSRLVVPSKEAACVETDDYVPHNSPLIRTGELRTN